MTENKITKLWGTAVGDNPEDKLHFLLFQQDGFSSLKKLRGMPVKRVSFIRRLFESVRRFWKRLTGQRWEKHDSYEMRALADFTEDKDPFYELLEHAAPTEKTLLKLHKDISDEDEKVILQKYACDKFPFKVVARNQSGQEITSQVAYLKSIYKIYNSIIMGLDETGDPDIRDDLYRILLLPDVEQKKAWERYLEANLNLKGQSSTFYETLQKGLDDITLKLSALNLPVSPFQEALLAINSTIPLGLAAASEAEKAARKVAQQEVGEAAVKIQSTFRVFKDLNDVKFMRVEPARDAAETMLEQFNASLLGDYHYSKKDKVSDRDNPWDTLLTCDNEGDRGEKTKAIMDGVVAKTGVDVGQFAQCVHHLVKDQYLKDRMKVFTPKKSEETLIERQEKSEETLIESEEVCLARQAKKIKSTRNSDVKKRLLIRHNQLLAPKVIMTKAEKMIEDAKKEASRTCSPGR